jgi:CheY-like chemotaxis protein
MRVLLIEDDGATAQSIELMLKSETFNIYTTDLGEEGIDLGKIYDYDIILLDLNLPDMSGFDVLRKLRVSRVGQGERLHCGYRRTPAKSALSHIRGLWVSDLARTFPLARVTRSQDGQDAIDISTFINRARG